MSEEIEESGGTRERILNAAEALFGERGFETVSLRDITGAAEANVAAVNYHFGSKDNLIDSVVERHVVPVNEERLRMLDVLEADAAGLPVPVEKLLEAFLGPLLKHITGGEMSERLFSKLMGRLMAERGYCLPERVQPLFQKTAMRFVMALRKSVPGLTEEKALWRMHFSFGVMANTLTHGETLRQISGGRSGDPPMDQQFAHIIEFCTAGLRADGAEGKEVEDV